MTRLQKELIDLLDEFGYDIFSVQMLKDCNRIPTNRIHQALRTLSKSGLLIKLERGKYIRSSFIESNVIGSFLAPDGGIAYWSALSYHNLTEQFVNVVFVQSAKRRSEELIINNTRYKLVKIKPNKLMGYKELGFGNHKFKITDLEKTILDCFDLPHLAGWYQELIKAFNNAEINQNRLIKYCKTTNNISVTKRLGFLAEFLQKPKMDKFIDYAQSVVSKPYSLFEIDGERQGEYNKKWKMIINMSKDEILEIANS